MPTLKELLEAAARHFDNQANAARAIGVHPSRFSTVLQSQGNPRAQSFELATCLRLAKALGRPAGEILEAAGKRSDHDLIVELYGGEKPASDLSHDERQLLAILRQESGSDELSSAVIFDNARKAMEQHRAIHERVDAILFARITLVEEQYEQRRRVGTWSSDPASYWWLAFGFAKAVTFRINDAVDEDKNVRIVSVAREVLRLAIEMTEKLPNDKTEVPPNFEPDFAPLRNLYERIALSAEEQRTERAVEARDVAQLMAIKDEDDRLDRLARYRRLQGLIYQSRVMKWLDENLDNQDDVKHQDDAITRFSAEMKSILSGALDKMDELENLLAEKREEAVRLERQADAVAASQTADKRAIPRIKKLRAQRVAVLEEVKEISERLSTVGGEGAGYGEGTVGGRRRKVKDT